MSPNNPICLHHRSHIGRIFTYSTTNETSPKGSQNSPKDPLFRDKDIPVQLIET